MKMAPASLVALTFGTLLALSCPCLPASLAGPNEELPFGFVPLEWVTGLLKKSLSPSGRYVILAARGSVRVYDSVEKIQEAKRALEELQNAPATLVMELTVRTGARRVTRQQYPSEEPALSYEVLVPRRYDPTRIFENSGGGVTIVPGLPRDFDSRRVESGAIVKRSPSGYATLTPEVRLSETGLEGGVVRKFNGSALLGRPVALTVSRKVSDPRALREWAVRHGAIPGNEPDWAVAGAEFIVTPALSNGYLSLQVVPQIVVSASDGRHVVRRIPISDYATGFLAQRNSVMPMQAMAANDPEFYALFLGVKLTEGESQTLMSLGAKVQYIEQSGAK